MSKKHKPTKKSTSTALARRAPTKPAPVTILPAAIMPAADAQVVGIHEVKLTKEEEAVLSRSVNPLDVLIKPTGEAYLSHPSYTRWFNAAFGRLGWAIVPIGGAKADGKTVILEHILYIHGYPAAKATGEQEYYEKNKNQTYGDAIEACTASALRRCAKRLGVGLELWDKAWLNNWIADNAIMVTVNDRGESKTRWRRKQDPPLRGEISAGRRGKQPAAPARTEFHGDDAAAIDAEYRGEEAGPKDASPKDATHGAEDLPITADQAQRLYKTADKVKRTSTEIKMWLKVVFGYNSSKEIKRKQYNMIMRTIEAPGPLPMREDREPGEDG